MQWAHLKIQALDEELRQQRIQLLGPHSETLSNLQLELLAEEEPGATRDEVEAEAQREPIPTRAARGNASRIRAGSRLPENLPRVEQVIPCAERTARRAARKPR